MNDETTIPPRQPNTPRVWLKRGVAWAALHPDWLIAFLFGFIAGAVIL